MQARNSGGKFCLLPVFLINNMRDISVTLTSSTRSGAELTQLAR